ncbi:MAG: hypothetical protein HYT79_12355 [Elusimicrobia bacterium]|nr:hypothetical protein [Elusimicrobiota bacterium]
MIEKELEQELLEYARRRYHAEKRQLLDLLDFKEREIEDLRGTIRDLEAQIAKLSDRLEEERLTRAEFLYHQEQDMARFHDELA